MKQKDKSAQWFTTGICVVIGLLVLKVLLALFTNTCIALFGIPGRWLEKDARAAGNVPNDFTLTQDLGNDIAALLFFDENNAETELYLYVRQTPLGYSERLLQDTFSRDVVLRENSDRECVLASNNLLHVSQVELVTPTGTQMHPVSPDQPFVLILPTDYTEMYYCDADGNRIQEIS